MAGNTGTGVYKNSGDFQVQIDITDVKEFNLLAIQKVCKLFVISLLRLYMLFFLLTTV